MLRKRRLLDLQLREKSGVVAISVNGICSATNAMLINATIEPILSAGKMVIVDLRKYRCSGRSCSNPPPTRIKTLLDRSHLAVVSAREEQSCLTEMRENGSLSVSPSIDHALKKLTSEKD